MTRTDEYDIAEQFLLATGAELPRPWRLMSGSVEYARGADRDALELVRKEIGGEIEYVES